METLGARLKYYREKNGWNQTTLGEMLGVTQQAIQRAEVGEARRPRYLKEAADLFGISYDVLVYGKDNNTGYAQSVPPANLSGGFNENRVATHLDLPLMSLSVGGEDGFYILGNDVAEFLPRPPHLVNVSKAYALYIYDNSMAPRYGAGDIVYIHPDRPVKLGDYVCLKRRNGTQTLCDIFCFMGKSHTGVCVKKIDGDREILLESQDVLAMDKIVLVDQST